MQSIRYPNIRGRCVGEILKVLGRETLVITDVTVYRRRQQFAVNAEAAELGRRHGVTEVLLIMKDDYTKGYMAPLSLVLAAPIENLHRTTESHYVDVCLWQQVKLQQPESA